MKKPFSLTRSLRSLLHRVQHRPSPVMYDLETLVKQTTASSARLTNPPSPSSDEPIHPSDQQHSLHQLSSKSLSHTGVFMDNNPHVFLDVANLIEGEGTPFKAARQILEEHVPLIERCCLKLWGTLPKQRFASSLTTIDERLHELLRDAGYQVEVAPALRTETMLIEDCSKRDDYLLKREVKRQRENGMREALIVSGDRDFESLALELSVFGTQFHYVQRQKQQTQRTMNMERHRCLQDFAAPLSNGLEQQFLTQQKRGIGTLSEPTLGPRLCLRFKGQEVEEIELFSGFTIGRTSGSSGSVDLCLAQYDRQKDYSRQLAQVHQLGEAWVLWRIPQDEKKLNRQPILYSASSTNAVIETQPIRSGENIILQPGILLNFERCDLQVTFKS